jgi:hypothetical protein
MLEEMDVLVVKTVLQVVVVLQLLDQQQVELMVELEVLVQQIQ